MSRVKITGKYPHLKIIIDDKELEFVQSFVVYANANGGAHISVNIFADELDIDIDDVSSTGQAIEA